MAQVLRKLMISSVGLEKTPSLFCLFKVDIFRTNSYERDKKCLVQFIF